MNDLHDKIRACGVDVPKIDYAYTVNGNPHHFTHEKEKLIQQMAEALWAEYQVGGGECGEALFEALTAYLAQFVLTLEDVG